MEFIEKVNLNNNVNYALNQSVQELLPDKIRTNHLARWIIDFPDLEESHKDSNERQLDIDSIVKIVSDFSKKDKKQAVSYQKFTNNSVSNKENLLEDILNTIIQNSLIPNISFYFSSLFHLGRQWQVSAQALETATKALEKDNLAQTVDQNSILLQDELIKLNIPKKEHESYLSEAFSEILNTARNQHSTSLSQSQKWWNLWQEEVNDLKEIVITVDEEIGLNLKNDRFSKDKSYRYRRRIKKYDWTEIFSNLIELTTFSFREKSLYKQFLEADITFKGINISEQNEKSLILNNLAYLSLFSMMTDEKEFSRSRRDISWEFKRIIHRLQDLQHKKRYEPIDREVETQLLRDFQKENPFEQYGVLQSPPNRYLLDLWNKCKLPSGETFYYAQNWLKSLDSQIRFWYSELPFTSKLTDKHIESYARSIDSTIKRQFVGSFKFTSEDKAGKTDTDSIQELFEQKCIVELVKGAVHPSKEKEGEQKWNVDNFREMIERVVQFLNERGYNLETPSKARLERLWDLATEDNINDRTEW